MKMENKSKISFSSAKKYFPMGITAFLVLVCGILFFFAVFKVNKIAEFFTKIFLILQPVIFGLAFAYLLDPVSGKIENALLLLPKSKTERLIKNKRIARGLSVTLSIIFALTVIFVLLNMVIPELVSSISSLISELPEKIDVFMVWLGSVLDGDSTLSAYIKEGITKIIEITQGWVEKNLLSAVQSWLGFFLVKAKDVVNIVLNLIIGVIISIYILSGKEKFLAQFKKLFYAVLKPNNANLVFDVLKHSNGIFGGFVTGKLIDSLIIGVLCFALMSVFRLPYTLLISAIVGVTNIIPFFGPFIGAIPSAFLILLVSPVKCLYFIILIIVLQQLDGNVIGPKILGNTTGLSAFWVVFAILLGGGLFGFLGMLLGVPTFGVIYYLLSRYINHILKKNGMPTDTSCYIEPDDILKKSN